VFVIKSNRPKSKRIVQLVFAAVMIVLPCVGPDVYGCQCREREPPCANYSTADAVFTGLVSRIDTIGAGPQKVIHFNVERAFLGLSSGAVEITGFGSSCDYTFEEGKKYLVYAYRTSERNELYTHYCTRTTELANAGDDLTYLNALSERGQSPQVMGVLADNDKTLKGISIVASSGGRQYRTRSDNRGRFKFELPRTGKYRVQIFLPLYADAAGTQAELDRISKRVMTKRSIILEYEVTLDSGKCAFINPPLIIARTEYLKHRNR
jgi:hypothetical protein